MNRQKNNKLFFSIIFLIFGFYCFIALTLIPVGAVLFHQNAGTWGDIFSLGQFIADLCLMPVAIVGFYLTLSELRKTQNFSDLYITWQESNKTEYTQAIKRSQLATYQTNNLTLGNNGNSPSTLYQITLELSKEYGHIQMSNSSGIWTGGVQGEYHKFVLTSASHLISFPNAPKIDLGKISFSSPIRLPSKIDVKYYIASENSDYKIGNLTIDLLEVEKD